MTITVNQFSISFYEKKEQQEFSTRSAVMPLSSLDRASVFIEQLHNTYNAKPSKSYASFSDEKNTTFSDFLGRYLESDIDFEQLAQQVLDVFKIEMDKNEFEETGYLLLIDYIHVATRYMMVGIVNLTEHFSVDAEFGIQRSRHLDISKIQLAARIDLSMLQHSENKEKVISFIKGRAGRKVNDFFMDLLGCAETVNAKQQSQQLLTAMDDFMATESLNPEEKTDTREKVYEYCTERLASGEEASLTELNDTLSLSADNEFKDFVQTTEYGFDDQFPLDKTTVRKLVKLSGSGKGVSVSFDRVLLGDRVHYQADTDTLTIKGIPATLKAHLLNEFGID